MDSNTLWYLLKEKSRDIETSMDSLKRKQTGSYYTDLELTDVMMTELVKTLKNDPNKRIEEYRFFEPCVGAGNFVFSYIKAIDNMCELERTAQLSLLNNIYVADINLSALVGYKESLSKLVKSYWGIELTEEYFDEHIRTGLLIDVTQNDLKYISLDDVFSSEVLEKKFDIVVTNPPYKNLKAERGHYSNDDEYEKDQKKYNSISKIVSKKFKYSTDGVLNLYKLFVEEIIDEYANENAYISLLIPSSIMSDKTCQKLRTHILLDNNLISVKVIGEGSGYIDAQQALSALLIKKGEKTTTVKVVKDYCNNTTETEVCIEDIINEGTGNSIIVLSPEEYDILKKLRKFPTVKELPFIVNYRGELDLTANKNSISETETGYKLLRGRNIGYYELIGTESLDSVNSEFVNATKKKAFIENERIICQQIANMHKERRLNFALVNAGYVLGNSCNFISVESNLYGIDIYCLLGLFNTKIINWYFKLTSSNNHINNYEIDCFPVPVFSEELHMISELTKQYLANKEPDLLEQIENCAMKAFSL